MTTKPAKHDLFNAILKQGLTVHVNFDPHARLVSVPPTHKPPAHIQQMLLKFDAVRCRGIEANAFGLEAGMTFGGAHWTVYVPWSAVYCISFDTPDGGQRGVVYNEDMPKSVIDSMVKKAALDEQQRLLDQAEPPRPKQATVEGGAKIYDFQAERAKRAARANKPAS